MKLLYYSIIVILIFSTSLYLKPIQADATNGIEIKNIRTLPPTIIIGQTFKISTTLVNHSSQPIFVDYGSCEAPFSVTFDTHVLVNETHPICNLSILQQKLNPGENTTATSPSLDLVYRAINNGTTNATITFPYEIWNQTSQSKNNEIVSKSFSFTIYGKTPVPTLSQSDNQAIIDVALAIPGLQKWSNDWQFVSMGFMTAKNQPGNWQYATVNLKASSNSSLIPCDSNNEDWSAWVMIDRTTMKVIQATYPTLESHNCNYATGGGPGTFGNTIPKIDTPLQQFRSGIAAKDVQCSQNLHLIIKAEDSSFACVTIETGKNLAMRGWATTFSTGISTNDYYTNCDTPYPQSDTGIAVLYMPTNSIGKICVQYHNLNNTPTGIGMRIFEANNLTQNASNVTAWTYDSTLEANVNKTIVYFIKTGTSAGFYGASLNCGGIPLAVGYDANSTITASDFPWVGHVFHCGVITYETHMEGTAGIGARYIPYSYVGLK